ncbi:bile acid-coenzyme A ligase [Crossiella equi]|uniref:Bile acid-coenzyme A ligase n=1 Tax=Crossiella equi TaxID=130796 RepID=A0ABS5A6R6_9PSEU|nr:AMP-binding protein [Crossiella equi]MBP2472291.1 bile acid-coenzyme A ligase [Crossiella equi]
MAVSSMVGVWARMARERPDAPAVTFGDAPSVSWGVLQRRTNQLARLFAERGVREGDFVTIALPNGIDAVEALLATLKLGAIPNPISHQLPRIEREQLVVLAEPRLVVATTEDGAAGRPVLIGGPDLTGYAEDDLPEVVSPSWKAPTSGGSTGRPKIILAGQPAVIDDGEDNPLRRAGFPVDGCCLFAGPMYHNTAVLGILASLSLRNHVVLEERFDPELTLRLIDRHRVRFTIMVPTMLSRMWRLPEEVRARHDLSSLDKLVHNAAPCPPEVKRAWLDWIGPDRLIENYTATEQSAMTLCDGHEWLARPGTVGRVVSGEMEVRGPDGEKCPPGVIGTIWMRRPAGTPPAFTYVGQDSPADEDGWETVGDLGHFDADGYLFLADRRQDLIISGGANIYPAEVELALMAHPSVLEAVVLGLTDSDLGQRTHALVRLDPERADEVDADALDEFARTRLVRYKCPRSYEFVDTPLRDDAGKVRRSRLAAERQGQVP